MSAYRIPKDPLLQWSLLLPNRRRPLPAALNRPTVAHLFWARNALYHGTKALGLPPGATILAPAYHCASAIEPLLQAGARIQYYRVTRSGAADLQDIDAKINGSTAAVLAIHYFGLPQPIAELRTLCTRRRLWMIEDCAHVLAGWTDGGTLGTFGDVAVFSLRKLLPLCDGGQLLLNHSSLRMPTGWTSPSWLYALKEMKQVIDKIADDSGGVVASTLSRLVRLPARLLRRSTSGEGAGGALSLNSFSMDFDLAMASVPMSRWSSRIMGNVSIPEVVARRRANYADLVKRLDGMAAVRCAVPDLPAGACPWICPVLAPERTDLHIVLRSRGIPAATWGGVIHPSLPIDDFPDARFLYDHLYFLPVHQDLGPREMDVLAAAVRAVASAA